MQRIQHSLAVAGAVAVFLSFASPWWTVSPAASPTAFTVTGFDASPALASLFLAACSAYGASLLSRKALRRVLSALHGTLSVLAATAGISHVLDPRGSLDNLVGRATGLTGQGAWDSVGLDGPSWWFALSVAGLLLGALSGIIGAVRTDTLPKATKFSRVDTSPTTRDSVGTWDVLSRGDDPTNS